MSWNVPPFPGLKQNFWLPSILLAYSSCLLVTAAINEVCIIHYFGGVQGWLPALTCYPALYIPHRYLPIPKTVAPSVTGQSFLVSTAAGKLWQRPGTDNFWERD